MITLTLSTIMFIGFMLLGIGVWNQLSYEEVYSKVEIYGNYVLDDIGRSFRESNIEEISLDNSFESLTRWASPPESVVAGCPTLI